MSLKPNEKNLMKILQALQDEKPKERFLACNRLWAIFPNVDDDESKMVAEALLNTLGKEHNVKVLEKLKPLLANYQDCPKAEQRIELFETAKKVTQEKKKAKENEEKLAREIDERTRQKQIHRATRLMNESMELEHYSYTSMGSKTRFPVNHTLIDIYKWFAIILVGVGILVLVLSIDDDNINFGFFVLGFCMLIALNMLLISEMIKLILDFHDSNYINANVRIKTLKVLESISESLKK